jgi:RNA polymerase sigma-70 factor (sigma-E family)
MRAELTASFVEMAAGQLPRLRRFAYAVCGDSHRADDLVQGALERMYVAWPRIHDVADPGAYVRTVLVRLAVRDTRRRWSRELATAAPPEQAAPNHAARSVDRLDLGQALAGLTPKQRAVLVLRFLEDRPVAEVAAILGIAEGTVKRQTHDALRQLRKQLSTATGPMTSALQQREER